MKLTSEQREALERYVFDCCRSNMFGDGMEEDYIRDGFPQFKGIKRMSDDELIDEAGWQGDEFDGSNTDAINSFLKELMS